MQMENIKIKTNKKSKINKIYNRISMIKIL